jgi:hypothetical protein
MAVSAAGSVYAGSQAKSASLAQAALERRQGELARLEANSEAARQQILGDTLGKLDVARIDALGKVQAEKEKTKKAMYIVAGIGGLIVVGGLTISLINRNK